MRFDPDSFLTRYADAFNGRDPEKLRTFFALEDPRFAVFDEYTERFFDGETYAAILEEAFDATEEMSFELLRCDRFGDFAIIHANQKIIDEAGEHEGFLIESRSRASMWVTLSGGEPRVVAARFAFLPSFAEAACSQGMCTG